LQYNTNSFAFKYVYESSTSVVVATCLPSSSPAPYASGLFQGLLEAYELPTTYCSAQQLLVLAAVTSSASEWWVTFFIAAAMDGPSVPTTIDSTAIHQQ
jgi:hypothetical protein